MVREIMRDEEFLKIPSENASAEDIPVLDDLVDTLRANEKSCVGMAANMIGVSKRIIVFDDNGKIGEMINPEILTQSGAFDAEEGCLSLTGTRRTKRYRKIKVRWQNRNMQTRIKNFEGFTAQIIQHEIDHLSGILI